MKTQSEDQRRRGLNFVRRQVAAGKATKKDIEQWESELGPGVRQIVQDAAPPKAVRRTASKPDTIKES
jgi:hypothetical protein